MLIHVSHLVDIQEKLAQQISEACFNIRRSITYEGPDSELGSELAVIIEQQRATTEVVRVARDDVDRKKDWTLPESFSDLWPWIQKTVEALAIVVVNGESEPDREGLLQSDADTDKCLKPLIWIGGNKLSRGLTIPSLCMSIFLRTTGAADSLLQMGRWFGYRDGYADLCRISTTIRLADRFMKVSCTLDDLGEQISSMNNLVRTPNDYQLIVQQHPGFLLTSASKMRTATDASCCYAGYRSEMRQFLVAGQTPRNNFVAAEHLIEDADNFGKRVYDSDHLEESEEKQPNWTKENTHPSGCLWRSVPADVVMQFFKSYCSPEGIGSSNQEIGRILRYIEEENASGPMAQVIGRMEAIAADTGCSIVFLHHASKGAAMMGAGDQQQASRGSSVLVDNIRWQSYLSSMTSAEAEEWGVDDDQRRFFVRFGVSKANYGAPFADRWFRRHDGGVLKPAVLERQRKSKGVPRGEA